MRKWGVKPKVVRFSTSGASNNLIKVGFSLISGQEGSFTHQKDLNQIHSITSILSDRTVRICKIQTTCEIELNTEQSTINKLIRSPKAEHIQHTKARWMETIESSIFRWVTRMWWFIMHSIETILTHSVWSRTRFTPGWRAVNTGGVYCVKTTFSSYLTSRQKYSSNTRPFPIGAAHLSTFTWK